MPAVRYECVALYVANVTQSVWYMVYMRAHTLGGLIVAVNNPTLETDVRCCGNYSACSVLQAEA